MRLVTWNIRGGKQSDVIKSVIAMAPDVAVLVDCKAKHADRITVEAAEAGYSYTINNHPTYTGIVMVSKHPLTQGGIKLDGAPQRWLHARSDHFDLDIAAVYGPLPKTIGTEPPMNEFWSSLVKACDGIGDRRAVLCGDFNTGVNEEDGPPKYRFRGANPFNDLKAHGWKDAYRELHREGVDRSWWNKERGFRIDHCMVSRAQALPISVDYSSGADGASDHKALVVDFSRI